MRTPATTASITAATLLLLAACTSGDEPPSDPTAADPTAPDPTTSEATEPAAPTEDPTDEPSAETPTENPGEDDPDADSPGINPDSFDAAAQESENFPGLGTGDDAGRLIDVRVRPHEGFERIAFEMTGNVIPDFRAEYVDTAYQDGSGFPVEIESIATLEVVVGGLDALAHDDAENPLQAQYDGTGALTFPHHTNIITEIIPLAPWEGMAQFVIGLDAERPFNVMALDDPVRLVVDVATG